MILVKISAHWLCAAVMMLLSGLDLAAQHVNWKTNYYAVSGNDLRSLHQSFGVSRPKEMGGHDGFTLWNVSWHFNTTYNGSVCRLAGFSTMTTITITLPRWVAPTNAADSLKAEWDRYIRALGQHEYGHAQFALTAAAQIQKRARETKEDPSCESLKQQINSICDGILQKYKHLDTAYDERTNHGLNDGARLGRFERPNPETK
jgi:predicted secreted Zn-dependent protease